MDLEEVKEKLGVDNEEQLEIADYEIPFEVHSEMPLWEINAKYRMVLEMEDKYLFTPSSVFRYQ